jgi:hydrogenase nickel incorporation protein HypA/HybF
MHEMALCESILEILTAQAEKQEFAKVNRVCLEVGPLSGVETEALRFGFDVVMRGSCAENAVLEIVTPPATAWCFNCATTVPIRQRFDPCPECGSHQLQVASGEELKIRELEVS